jgi:hypothetical protein
LNLFWSSTCQLIQSASERVCLGEVLLIDRRSGGVPARGVAMYLRRGVEGACTLDVHFFSLSRQARTVLVIPQVPAALRTSERGGKT